MLLLFFKYNWYLFMNISLAHCSVIFPVIHFNLSLTTTVFHLKETLSRVIYYGECPPMLSHLCLHCLRTNLFMTVLVRHRQLYYFWVLLEAALPLPLIFYFAYLWSWNKLVFIFTIVDMFDPNLVFRISLGRSFKSLIGLMGWLESGFHGVGKTPASSTTILLSPFGFSFKIFSSSPLLCYKWRLNQCRATHA